MASGKLLNLSGAEEVRGPLEAVGREASNTEAQVDVSLFEIQWEKDQKKIVPTHQRTSKKKSVSLSSEVFLQSSRVPE